MIPYGRQEITDADIASVVEVLQSDYLTQGPAVPRFEQEVAKHVGAPFAVAVNSATSALHIACLALGLGPGDRLWTSPISFVASANCGLYCGAQVDFVDIDPDTYNLSPTSLEEKLIKAKRSGKLPKIVVAVHLCGQSCDMASIHALSQKYGFSIIEDASHAIGGKYKGEYIGSCRYSDVTVFSFHPVKVITTAEGGLATTKNKKLASSMALLRTHGITRDVESMTHEPEGPWYYEQIELGYNYRMTDIQAALGLSQLRRLDTYVTRRHEFANNYSAAFKNLPLTLPFQSPDCYSAFHLFVVLFDPNKTHRSRADIFAQLRSRGIGVNVHYIPIHTQPFYRALGFAAGEFPIAESYYEKAISLPLHQGLSPEDQNTVVRSVFEILSK